MTNSKIITKGNPCIHICKSINKVSFLSKAFLFFLLQNIPIVFTNQSRTPQHQHAKTHTEIVEKIPIAPGNENCFPPGFGWNFCCNPRIFQPEIYPKGNENCFDGHHFTYEKCCFANGVISDIENDEDLRNFENNFAKNLDGDFENDDKSRNSESDVGVAEFKRNNLDLEDFYFPIIKLPGICRDYFQDLQVLSGKYIKSRFQAPRCDHFVISDIWNRCRFSLEQTIICEDWKLKGTGSFFKFFF